MRAEERRTREDVMTQDERLEYLIGCLLREDRRYSGTRMPEDVRERRRLLRALMNLRPPAHVGEEFLAVQDDFLRAELEDRGVTDLRDLSPVEPGIYLWRGDITTLRCGAIVNAANSGLTGCYVPCHRCIDNAIHTYAGVQLRLECAEIMARQGSPEGAGRAKLTRAYNLPCEYVLHTVGPVIYGEVTAEDRETLASCYRSCLELAGERGISSVAFCCISTGEFRFPNDLAAEIAVETVRKYAKGMEVIFDVFKDRDYRLYQELLGEH